MLARRERPIAHEGMDSTENSLEEGADDPGPADIDNTQAASLSPSSMGLSFRVDLEVAELQVTARWGHYQRVSGEALEIEKTGRSNMVWQRTQRDSTCTLPL